LPHGSGAAKIRAVLHHNSLSIKVHPEFLNCDLWLELRVKKRAALIIIENKIWAREGDGQLVSYTKKAEVWKKQHGGEVLLIFLTRKGEPPSSERWVPLSYLNLATSLRKTWRENEAAAGRAWLSSATTPASRSTASMRSRAFEAGASLCSAVDLVL
jgi:hypothetical protein